MAIYLVLSLMSFLFAALTVCWCHFTSVCGGNSAGDMERVLWGHRQMDFSLKSSEEHFTLDQQAWIALSALSAFLCDITF